MNLLKRCLISALIRLYVVSVRLFLAVVFLVTASCGGGGSANSDGNVNVINVGSGNNPPEEPLLDCPGASQTTGRIVNVSGKITYDRILPRENGGLNYSDIRVLPARSLKVAALDGGGTQLAATVTDLEGNYSLAVNDRTCIKIRAFAQTIAATENLSSWDFKVTDNTGDNALYAMDGELKSSGSTDTVRNLHAESGWNGESYGDRVAAPFAIIDTVYTAVHKVLEAYSALTFPPFELRWSINNRPVENGNLETGEIGNSFFTAEGGAIYLLGAENADTDEYDEHLILHEWAHYFENAFSRSDSLGGSHTLDDRLDLRVSFGEGWANAWSAIASDNPVYSDALGVRQQSGFSFDMEANSAANPGWFNESSVHSILYDIYDDANEPGDDISLPVASILDVLMDNDYKDFTGVTSLYAYLQFLRESVPNAVSAIDKLVDNQFIGGSGFFGTGETNGSGAVPVYSDLSPGNSLLLCSDNDYGEYNKIQNRRLIRLPISVPRLYRVSVQAVTSEDTRTDPEVYIWLKGRLMAAMESPVNNSENGSVNLQAGDYVLELFDFYNVDEDESTGGRACFNIRVF